MAELNYNGDKVNSVVSELTTIGGKFTPVANSVKTATGVMVGCKGFNLISDLTATSLSDGITACEQAIGALVGDIRTQQVKILTFSQDQAAIDAFVDSLSTAEYQALDLSGISSKISFWDKAGFVAKGGLNSSGAFFMGFGEGILNFAETIGDGVVMIGASAATLFTKPMDLINETDLTTELWDKTKAYVAEEKVASAFDEIYANTTFGQQIKQNAYAFDTVRGIGKGIGYSTALAVTTGPNAILTPIAAGVAGMANGSEEAWGNGATTGKGLLYGAASGAWETVQWGAGMKINSIGKHVGDVGFKAADAFRRVGLDVLDSGVEGFVQPALTMIYQKYDGNSLAEKYAAAFESNGGWNGVLQQAVIGGMMSAGSEGMDVIKYKVKGGNKAAGVFDSEGEASTKPETDSDGKPKTEPADSSKGTGSKETNVTEMPVDKTAAGLIEGDSDVQLRAAIGKGTGDDVSVKNTGAGNVDSNARPETTLKPNTETRHEVNSVKIDVNSGKTDVNPVKTNATPARTDVSPVRTDATSVRTDVNLVRTDASPARTDVSPVRTDATPARTDVSPVRTDVNLVRTDASPARTDVSPVRKDATPSRTDVNLVITDATPSRTDVNLVRTDASPVGTKPEVQMKQTGGAQTSVDTMRNATTSITSLSGDAGSVIKLGGEVAAGGAALTSVISKTSGVDINLGHGNADVNTAGIDLDVNVRGGTDVSIRGGSNASVHSRADTNVRSDADVSVHGRTDASVRSDVDASTRGVDTSIKGDVDAGEFRLTGKETSDQMLDKIDKAVDDGRITREQADKMIDDFSDTAKKNDLLEERAQLLQDRDANIERKKLLVNEDGAKPGSVKGYDEAVSQIDKRVAEIDKELGKLDSQTPGNNPSDSGSTKTDLTPASPKKISETRESLEGMSETLGKRKNELSDAQTALDNYKKTNPDDVVGIADLQKKVDNAQQRYDLQKDKVLDKAQEFADLQAQQSGKVGSEKYKVINDENGGFVQDRPSFTDASAQVEGDVGYKASQSTFSKLPKDSDAGPIKTNGGDSGSVKTTGTSDKTLGQQITDTRKSLEGMSETLGKRKNELTDAQTALDNYKKTNPDDASGIADLQKKVYNAQQRYDLQKNKVLDKTQEFADLQAQQPRKVGSEKYKVINDENGGFVQDRPSFTDAFAQVEGDVGYKASQSTFSKLPKDSDVNVKPSNNSGTDVNSSKTNVGDNSHVTPEGGDVRSIKQDGIDGKSLGITGKETSDQILDKIDKAVDSGKITREQADKLIDDFGDTVHKNDLLDEKSQLLQDKQANIDRKELLVSEDGAKAESVKGYDEAVSQIDQRVDEIDKELGAMDSGTTRTEVQPELRKTDVTETSTEVNRTDVNERTDTQTEVRKTEGTEAGTEVNRTDVNERTDTQTEVRKTEGTETSTEVNKTDVNERTDTQTEVRKTEGTETSTEVNRTDVNERTDTQTELRKTERTETSTEVNKTDVNERTDTQTELRKTEGTETGTEVNRTEGTVTSENKYTETINSDGTKYTKEIGENGSTTESLYDSQGNLVKKFEKNADGTAVNSDIRPDGTYDKTSYDANGNIITKESLDVDGSVRTEKVNADGTYEKTTVNSEGKVTSKEWSDADGTVRTEKTNADGTYEKTTVDSEDKVFTKEISNTDGSVRTEKTNADGTYEKTTVDSEGKVISREIKDTDGTVRTEKTNADGTYEKTTVDSEGKVTSKEWSDADGTVRTEKTNADGTYEKTTVDSEGKVTSREVKDTDGRVYTEKTNADGTYNKTTVDKDGKVIAKEWSDTDGTVRSQKLNDDGTMSRHTVTNDGTVRDTVFDKEGNILNSVEKNADGSTSSFRKNSDGTFERTTVDSDGRVTAKEWSDTDGTVRSQKLNDDGTMSRHTVTNDGTVRDTVFDKDGNILTSVEKHTDGSIKTVKTNADGTYEKTIFDSNGNVVSKEWTESNGSYHTEKLNADGTTSKYTKNTDGTYTNTKFDKDGNLLGKAWSNSDGSTHSEVYFSDGTKVKNSIDVDGTRYETHYDKYGNVSSSTVVKPDGTFGTYTVKPDGSKETVFKDKYGSVTSKKVTNPDGTVSFTVYKPDGTYESVYKDASGKVTGKEYTLSTGGKVQEKYGSDGTVSKLLHDSSGKPYQKEVISPDGSKTKLVKEVDGTFTQYEKKSNGNFEVTKYDKSGNPVSKHVTTPDGKTHQVLSPNQPSNHSSNNGQNGLPPQNKMPSYPSGKQFSELSYSQQQQVIIEAESMFRQSYGGKVSGMVYGSEYKFKFDSQGHAYVEWIQYSAYKKVNGTFFDKVKGLLSKSEVNHVSAYIDESGPLCYKTMNGIMRDNLFEYDAAGNITHVVEHGMFGTHKTPVADYLKFNKISLEQLVANNKKAVLDIDSAIRQSPLQGDMMTYRGLNELSSSKRLFGVDFTNMSAAEIEQAVMAKGHFVTEGFFSTAATPKAGPVSGASIVYEIKNKAGTPALDLSKLGGIGSEQEVLIAANTPYKFTGVKVESGPSGKKVIIQCEVADGFDPALAGKLFRQQTEATFGKVDSKAKNSPFYHSPYGSGSSGGNSGGYGHGSGYSGHGYYGGPSTPSPSPYGGGLPSDVII